MAHALETTGKKFLKSYTHVGPAPVSTAEPLLPGRANGSSTSIFCHSEIVIYFLLSNSLALHFPFLLFCLVDFEGYNALPPKACVLKEHLFLALPLFDLLMLTCTQG